jgi:uncharacterized membrane protein YjfL (UPF0719 family)
MEGSEMDWEGIISEVQVTLAFVGVYAIIFLVAKAFKDVLTPYNLIEELAKRDNFAVGISLGGYFLASAFIFVGAVSGPSQGLMKDIAAVSTYALLGLVFLNLSRWCLDKLVFHKFCNITAIVEDRNCGMAAVRFGVYIATGLIAGASLHGEGGSALTAIVFFILGQIVLIIFSKIYDWTTPFHLQDEVKNGNLAAGVAFGGNVAALGVIVARSVYGDFISWTANLIIFAEVAVTGIVILQIVRVFMDKLILTGHDINKEISEDKNVAAGFVEMSVALSFALVLAALI